jgi:hypothetical protein
MWPAGRRLSVLLSVAVVCVATAAAAGLPEGPKKPPIPVSFLAHHTEWIDVLYPPSARDRVAPLIAQAEDVRAELAVLLGQPPLSGVEVRVARGPEEIATLAPPAPPPRPDATGIAYPSIKLVILSLSAGGEPSDLEIAFRRELAKVALFQATAGRELPGWLTEGLALHFSGEGRFARWALLLRASVGRGIAPLSADAAVPDTLARAQGADFFGWLVDSERKEHFPTVPAALGRGASLADAVQQGYGTPLASLESAWRRDLARRSTLAVSLIAVGVPLLLIGAVCFVRAIRTRRTHARAARSVLAQNRARAAAVLDRARVHIVLSRREEPAPPPVVEAEVPKVEHEGGWHTLH